MSNALNWFEIPVTDLARASAQGAIIYLDAGDDLAGALSRVEAAGGKVVMGATHLSDQIGSIAMFLDSEGNRAAFHSRRSSSAVGVAGRVGLALEDVAAGVRAAVAVVRAAGPLEPGLEHNDRAASTPIM